MVQAPGLFEAKPGVCVCVCLFFLGWRCSKPRWWCAGGSFVWRSHECLRIFKRIIIVVRSLSWLFTLQTATHLKLRRQLTACVPIKVCVECQSATCSDLSTGLSQKHVLMRSIIALYGTLLIWQTWSGKKTDSQKIISVPIPCPLMSRCTWFRPLIAPYFAPLKRRQADSQHVLFSPPAHLDRVENALTLQEF